VVSDLQDHPTKSSVSLTTDHPSSSSSENQFQAQLDLARGEGGVGLEEVLRLLVIAGIRNSIYVGRVFGEGGGLDRQPAGGDLDSLVIAVEQVEGVGGELQSVARGQMYFAHEAKVGGGIVRAGESVAAVAGESVVVVVAILVRIAADGGVDGASAAGRNDAGNLPFVENVAKEFMFAVEGTRFHRERGDEAVALVGDAGSALAIGVVGILYCGGRASDECVLAVVDGMSISVGESKIGAVGHTAVDGQGGSVVNAGSGALKFIDRAELRDRSDERIDAGRERAGQRLRPLPTGEGIDSVKGVLNGASGIEQRIGEGNWRRKIDVEGANQMFAVDIEI